MQLTERMKNLLGALKHMGFDKDETANLLSLMDTDKKEEQLENWLYWHIKTYGNYPKREVLMEGVGKIAEGLSETPAA